MPGFRTFQATESRTLEQVLALMPTAEADVRKLQARLGSFIELTPGKHVLEIGAAQGVTLLAFARAGFEVSGVEPWGPAIEVGRVLSARHDMQIDVREGVGESLPFDDDSFDYVHCNSVLEHVDDPWAVFREAYRVLRPGGGFFFSTTTVLRPTQNEIGRFPLFPWYPAPVKRRIMTWATEKHPELVGGTTRPAVNWFRHDEVRRRLRTTGFQRIVDMWQLRDASGLEDGPRGLLIKGATRSSAVRFLGNLTLGGVQYLAIK